MNVIIVSHSWTHGVQHELRNYLNRKETGCTVLINHPLPDARQPLPSTCEVYRNGTLSNRWEVHRRHLPELLSYCQDPFYTLFFLKKVQIHFDLFIGADSINALTGLWLKNRGSVERVIYYSHSLRDKRYSFFLSNMIYHYLDTLCIRNSDYIWNLSRRLTEKRSRQNIPPTKNLWVPVGINYNEIKRLPTPQVDRYHLVFSGHLRKTNGLELAIKALPALRKKIPPIKLTIIGSGEIESGLRNMVKESGLEDCVQFIGLMDYHHLLEFLPHCGIGIAPYTPDPDSIIWSTDPTKIKDYLACGLPVIVTNVAESSIEIEEEKAGQVISYDQDEFQRAVEALTRDEKIYAEYKQNAIRLASRYDWDIIYDRVMAETS